MSQSPVEPIPSPIDSAQERQLLAVSRLTSLAFRLPVELVERLNDEILRDLQQRPHPAARAHCASVSATRPKLRLAD